MPHTDPHIDAYIAKSAAFAQPVLAHLRAVVHAACPSVEESMKWSMPFFIYQGKILANMAAFKAHCSFGFWMGERVAVTGKEHEGMGQLGRITSAKDLPTKRELTAMIKQAVALIDAGEKSPISLRKRTIHTTVEIPEDLSAALKRNAAARNIFDTFTPGKKREYINWINEAKRETTRAARVEKTVLQLAEGRTLNARYER